MFPTQPVVMCHRTGLEFIDYPGMENFNPMMILHGSEAIETFKPIEVDSTVIC